jgi:hypothetical protein
MERLVKILYYFRDDLRLERRIAEPIRGSVESANPRLLRDYGLGFVPNHRPAE